MKTINNNLTTVTIAALLFITGCDPYDMKLKIVNQTDETIFIDISKAKSFKSYPVVIDEIKKDTIWNYMTWIKSKDSLEVPAIGNSWEGVINKQSEDSTLTIFIFDRELLKSVPPDSLVSKQLYTKKFAYKVKDLEKLNWRVEYK